MSKQATNAMLFGSISKASLSLVAMIPVDALVVVAVVAAELIAASTEASSHYEQISSSAQKQRTVPRMHCQRVS